MTRLGDVDLSVDRQAELPVGTQLAQRLRGLVDSGRLRPGDRLPSIRDLAVQAGVNVNTVRAVYARLDREGLTLTEHGRGTFVADGDGARPPADDRGARRELQRQIARLERELVRRPQLPATGPPVPAAPTGNLLTTEELQAVHDELLSRLRQLDDERADVVQRLSELERASALEPDSEPERRSSTSLSGAQVRWVGAS